MSAFAALKDGSSAASLFHERSDVESDDDIVKYQKNSSDDDESDHDDPFLQGKQYESVQHEANYIHLHSIPFTQITRSKFTPNNENVILLGTNVMVGLKHDEYIVVNGQFNLKILTGTALVNNLYYLGANSEVNYPVIAPQSQALPIIAGTSVKNKVGEDCLIKGCDTVVLLETLASGMENVGLYYAPFKNMIFNSDDLTTEEKNNPLGKYSFQLVLREIGNFGLHIDEPWRLHLDNIVQDLLISSPKIIMVIGNKNTGKSTFSKSLLNDYIIRLKLDISYLDIDPGQSEFSDPYTLSLTNELNPCLGLNIPYSRDGGLMHYFGYTTPIHEPSLYISIVKNLFLHFKTSKSKNHLIINTPGWIKGYGKEVLKELTEFIIPHELVLLSNSLDPQNSDNFEILNSLQYRRSRICQGIFQISKYSASQLRSFNKLVHFHQVKLLKFDFKTHLLSRSPLRLSYQTSSSASEFRGVDSICFLNNDVDVSFNIEDLFLMLDSTMVGLYVIEDRTYKTLSRSFYKPKANWLPSYCPPASFHQLISSNGNDNMQYLGLVLIHSINRPQQYLNVYLPEASQLKAKLLLSKGSKVLLVRGDGEIPSPEIFNPNLVSGMERKYKKHLRDNKVGCKGNIPYMNFENKSKVGGVWKVRRNVLRRSHQR